MRVCVPLSPLRARALFPFLSLRLSLSRPLSFFSHSLSVCLLSPSLTVSLLLTLSRARARALSLFFSPSLSLSLSLQVSGWQHLRGQMTRSRVWILVCLSCMAILLRGMMSYVMLLISSRQVCRMAKMPSVFYRMMLYMYSHTLHMCTDLYSTVICMQF